MRHQQQQQNFGFARALKLGALAGVAVALVGALAFFGWVVAHGGLPGEGGNDVTSVLIMVGMPDENNDFVAQAMVRVDGLNTASPTMTSVDTSASVTVVGTSYNKLRDAYAFGGGARVVESYERLWGARVPYLDYGPAAIDQIVEENGGISLTIPADMSVFDGDKLYTFTSGPATLSADEFRAVLNGAAYLAAGERTALLKEVGSVLVGLTAEYPGGLAAAIDLGDVSTDLSAEGLAIVEKACAALR